MAHFRLGSDVECEDRVLKSIEYLSVFKYNGCVFMVQGDLSYTGHEATIHCKNITTDTWVRLPYDAIVKHYPNAKVTVELS